MKLVFSLVCIFITVTCMENGKSCTQNENTWLNVSLIRTMLVLLHKSFRRCKSSFSQGEFACHAVFHQKRWPWKIACWQSVWIFTVIKKHNFKKHRISVSGKRLCYNCINKPSAAKSTLCTAITRIPAVQLKLFFNFLNAT